ncbi:GNAT family N-acetyltransferase [Chitinophaga sp. GbtcB8]|uniref:GNAT family N-acetyltransferase n=1 Tax=Chitinophaga sp. GbtcB8 TaxID=2824753 RepID=UPI001C30DC5D|nr:GNAT family protein [Chitinophaga sp. GbtcB8]
MKTNEERLFDSRLTLENDRVKVRIVSPDDIGQLKDIAFDPSIWTYFTSEISTEQQLVTYVEDALKEFAGKQKVPFVIIDKKQDRIAGMSSFGNISLRDARIEIGWSWLSPDAQGTGINGLYKSLLMAFAFDELNMMRVEFKTDVLNQKARKALLKIGATEEGILRSHTLMPHNRRRDTIYYSILKPEWEQRRQQV